MIPLELDSILKYLQTKNISAKHQKETNQICIVFKLADREFPLFIRIYEGGELLQLLAFLPCNIKSETAADTARLLHLLNKELDIPGFGMDETTSVVFYRCMLPIKNKQIDESILDAYINAIQVVSKSFAAVISAVAYGAVTFAEVVQKSKEHGSHSTTQMELEKD